MRIDPTDIFVGLCIRNERAIEEINEIKASLELAARQSPKVFADVSLALLPKRRALRVTNSLSKETPPSKDGA
ncbi:MAG: hypothetical protein NZ805_15690 [Armatimonadetes bacterium]|nr:hypothetical protein [Armatimonadota bacterium]MDW8028256.1 hypothetical protein [Armatimonadota bacterium]